MLSKLNEHALDRIDDYLNLRVYKKKVRTSYYINNVGLYVVDGLMEKAQVPEEHAKKVHEMYKNKEAPFGWYRGKGSPEELESAVIEISKQLEFNLENANPEGIREFMKLYGLGVDCSGFVFHVLHFAFEKLERLEEFINSLAWAHDEKHQVSHAGVFVFAGHASTEIAQDEIQPLDLVLINLKGEYTHMALIVEKDSTLLLAQSNLDSKPSGVTLSEINITNGGLKFSYEPQIATDWNTYFDKGIIELRRLKVLYDF